MRYLPVPGGRTRIRVVVAAPRPTQPAHQDQPGAATVLQVTPAPTLANHPPTVTTRIRGCPHQRPTTAPLSPSAPSPVPPQVNECDSLPERANRVPHSLVSRHSARHPICVKCAILGPSEGRCVGLRRGRVRRSRPT